jgi:hypothetical protein
MATDTRPTEMATPTNITTQASRASHNPNMGAAPVAAGGWFTSDTSTIRKAAAAGPVSHESGRR